MPTDIISTQEATTLLQNRGITDLAIIAEMIRGSQNRFIYIALQVDTYHFIARNRKPSALDFRVEFEPIIERYIRHLELGEKEMLRLLARMPIWDKEMAKETLEKFYPTFSLATFDYIMGLSCMLPQEKETYILFEEIRAFLLKDSLPFPENKLFDFLFDIYDKKLKIFLGQNLTSFEGQFLDFSFEIGTKTNDIKTFCLWFEHTTEAFEEAEQYALLLSLNEKLSALLVPNKNDFYPAYSNSLYKRIQYNLLLNRPAEARKILQSLSPAQLTKYKELYPLTQNFTQAQVPQAASEEERKKWEINLQSGVSSDIEKGDLHYKIAKDCLENEEYDNAYFHIKESHKARRNVLGDYHEDTVDCLILMGQYYQKKENTSEAVKHYQKALDISLKNDRHDEIVAGLLFEIADMSIKRKDFQKAVDYFKRAIREWELMGVELNESIATCHFKIAYVHDEVRNWDPALQHYSIALGMRKSLFGETHEKVADTLHNIGTIYFNRGVYQEAIRYLEKAIKVRIDVSNTVRRSLALSYYNLALAYLKMNRIKDAKYGLEKAIAIFDRIDDDEMRIKSKNVLMGI